MNTVPTAASYRNIAQQEYVSCFDNCMLCYSKESIIWYFCHKFVPYSGFFGALISRLHVRASEFSHLRPSSRKPCLSSSSWYLFSLLCWQLVFGNIPQGIIASKKHIQDLVNLFWNCNLIAWNSIFYSTWLENSYYFWNSTKFVFLLHQAEI